jgi:2-deoxystreptamine N-acetyl-D-glucosaminyltransferase/2-deoxystreptamine glucosyltransferase
MRFDPVGGMANQLRQISAELARRGFRETVLTLGNSDSPQRLRASPTTDVRAARAPWPPIRSELSGTFGLVYSWAIAVTAWLLRNGWRLDRTYDVVHVNFDGTLAPPMVLLVAKRCTRLPIIVTLNCCRGATLHREPERRGAADRWKDRFELRALRAADKIQCITERTADYLIRHGIAASRVTVIEDLVDTTRFRRDAAASAAMRRRFNVPSDATVVLFASRVSWEKGWEYFLDAAALMRDRTDYLFVISSGGLQQKRLLRRIAELRLRNVILTGYLEHDDMPAALGMADVFVFPSKYEELGSTLLEVMAVGVPIVGARVGGIPEVLDYGRAGLVVESESGAAIVEAIERITSDQGLQESLRENARRQIDARYDKEIVLKKIERMYASVMPAARR